MTEKFKNPMPFYHPITIFVTCLWTGKFPIASGTVGSLFALVLFIILFFIPRELGWFGEEKLLPVLIMLTIIMFIVGTWTSQIYMKKTNRHDPKEIVIDELVGQWVTLALTGSIYTLLLYLDSATFLNLLVLSPQYLIILFLLFRLFDITKPSIIGVIDKKMEGGMGVMLDDVMAGVFASLSFYFIFFVMLYSGGFTYIFENFLPDYLPRQ